MLKKFIDSYDDSECYISNNKDKIAQQNKDALGEFIIFSNILYAFFIVYEWVLSDDVGKIIVYLIPIFVLALWRVLFNKVSPILNSFEKVRGFALVSYTVIILSISYADMMLHHGSRSFMIPAAILVISAFYMDHFSWQLGYKIVLGVFLIIMEVITRNNKAIPEDIILIIICVLMSVFCYFNVMRVDVNRGEDNRVLEEKSKTDLLTGLLNKISYEEYSKNSLNGRIIGAKAIMFMFDFDNFKHVNDQYGHQTGDEALKNFASILRSYFHPTDIVGRVGGDEFMVLVMGEMPTELIEDRCRSILHELKISRVGEAAGFSCSIGICVDTRAHTFEEMYNIADSALYIAKENGKAQYVMKHTE